MKTRVIQELHPVGTGRPVIEVHHLTKDYGDVRAVDDLSFTVEPGAVTGVPRARTAPGRRPRCARCSAW